jgi:hypothetical protein
MTDVSSLVSLASGTLTRTPSMLLGTIRAGPKTYMGVGRACDEATAAPSSVPRAFFDPFLRGVTFLATKIWDEILKNKANQQCHFKNLYSTSRVQSRSMSQNWFLLPPSGFSLEPSRSQV